MKKHHIPLIFLGMTFMACHSGSPKMDLSISSLPEPGLKPELFAPGIVSNAQSHERDISISFDHEELYFTRNGFTHVMSLKGGSLSEPVEASFAKEFLTLEAQFSLDGEKIYFISRRPDQTEGGKLTYQMWFSNRVENGWDEPSQVNGLGDFYYTFTKNGKVYFTDSENDLYYSEGLDNITSNRVKLPALINTSNHEYNAFVDPHEKYLIFTGENRPDGMGSGDMYVSFMDKSGQWGRPVNMGPGINSSSMDYCPYVSPDGKYLFFSSRRTGNSEIYWVSTDILEELKKRNLDFMSGFNDAIDIDIETAELFYKEFSSTNKKFAGFDGSQLEAAARNQSARGTISNIPEILGLIQKFHPNYKNQEIQIEKAVLSNGESDLNDIRSKYLRTDFVKSSDLDQSVNILGYFYLQNEQMDVALKLFKLNCELYPDWFNAWDSYGEGLLASGDTVNSLIAYKKSLELNDQNKNAADIIKKLESVKPNRKMAIVEYDSVDLSISELLTGWSKQDQIYLEDFFQKQFKNQYILKIHPNRSSLNQQWRLDWNYPEFESQCWMVASGTGSRLDILSPRVWADEACEHDPDDFVATRQLFLHEMVHTFHGQNNPSPAFDNTENIDWLIEGLAVFASGQLDNERMEPVIEMVRSANNPTELSNLWKGANRYGLAGSVVEYIDQTYGRNVLSTLLEYTTANEVLNELELTENELIDSWKQWVLKK